jgi:dihydroflavonol-4-reductase
MSKIAFVTGSAGFLGLNLVEELLKQKWQVIAMHLPSDNLKYLSKLNVTLVSGDIIDYNSLLSILPQNTDAVFHTAGITSMWNKHNKLQHKVNVNGTQNVVNACLEKTVKKLIFTSSISAFGYHGKVINENTASNAMDCKMNYNITKYLAEQIVRDGIKRGLNAVMLNPCNIIGPYDIHGWANLIKAVKEDKIAGMPPGRAMFCHVNDIVVAHVNAFEHGISGENYLLGGVETGFKDVFNEIEKQLGKNISSDLQPKWKLKLASWLFTAKSVFDGKEPLITYAKYKRLTGYVSCNYSKAIEALGYKTSTIKSMITDSYNWLQKENLL